jgi:hypothetical protein
MTKTEAIMRLMEVVSGDKPYKITLDLKIGWTSRKAVRRVLPIILLRECPLWHVEGSIREDKRWLNSTFYVTLVGKVKDINNFVRMFDANVRLEMI